IHKIPHVGTALIRDFRFVSVLIGKILEGGVEIVRNKRFVLLGQRSIAPAQNDDDAAAEVGAPKRFRKQFLAANTGGTSGQTRIAAGVRHVLPLRGRQRERNRKDDPRAEQDRPEASDQFAKALEHSNMLCSEAMRGSRNPDASLLIANN